MQKTGTTRQVLAVMVVATVLCAEQVATAAPGVRPQAVRPEPVSVPQVVQIANKLAQRFRQIVPSTVLRQECQSRPVDQPNPLHLQDQLLSVAPHAFSPFQFRLPPPVA